MRVLAMTKIFPNAARPLAAPYFRQQFVALSKLCELEVFGLIPWFPGVGLFRGSRMGQQVGVPARDSIDGLSVRHPRVLHTPKYGFSLMGATYTASLLPVALSYRGKVDAIFATWAYPDGFAATWLSKVLRVPVIVQVIGSDINVESHKPGPRANLKLVMPRVDRVIAVSRQLADSTSELGIPAERCHVIVTGIDTELFRIRDRAEARREIGAAEHGKLLLYVGRLEAEKGAFDLLDAFDIIAEQHDDYRLIMVGDGSRRAEVAERAKRWGDRVQLTKEIHLSEIPKYMAASDLVTLPSWAEGTPNVLIESLVCGRPFVASRVGGIPDMYTDPIQGELVEVKDPPGLADALVRVASEERDPQAVQDSYPHIDWNENARRVLEVIEGAVRARGYYSPAG